jgi:hypothetical protein
LIRRRGSSFARCRSNQSAREARGVCLLEPALNSLERGVVEINTRLADGIFWCTAILNPPQSAGFN